MKWIGLILASFIFFIFGVMKVGFTKKTAVEVSYLVDRSLSALFISDEEILKWIKNDVGKRKVNRFNIISFGCDFNQSQIFSSATHNIFIPKIKKTYCTDLQNVLYTGKLFNNIVIMSDLKFNKEFTNNEISRLASGAFLLSQPTLNLTKKKGLHNNIVDDISVEFVNFNELAYDTLKIVSWQIPSFVLNNSKVRVVLQVWSKLDNLIEINIKYARKIRRYYRIVRANQISYISFFILSKKPYEFMQIEIKEMEAKDRYVLNNMFFHRFTFTDKILAFIESNYNKELYESSKDFLELADIENAQVVILDTNNLQQILNTFKTYYGKKHIIVFLDTYIIERLPLYTQLEEFLPIKLIKKRGRQFFFLLDTSGSMNLTLDEDFNIKGYSVLSDIIDIIKNIIELKSVNIFLFSSEWKRVEFKNIEQLKEKLLNIQFYGNTKISGLLRNLINHINRDDHIYIFTDTFVKDNTEQLERFLKTIIKKKAELHLVQIGKKKGRLYRVFKKLGLKIFKYSRNKPHEFLEGLITKVGEGSYVDKVSKVYDTGSGMFLFEVNNLLRTKLKDDSRNIMDADAGSFVSFSLKDHKTIAVILKSAKYLIESVINIKEIFNAIFGRIIQKQNELVIPYYFGDRIFLHTNIDNTCNHIILRNGADTVYFFKKSSGSYESNLSAIPEGIWHADICGVTSKLNMDEMFLRNNEIFFNTKKKLIDIFPVEFPALANTRLKATDTSIMWFFLSLALLLIESLRRIISTR